VIRSFGSAILALQAALVLAFPIGGASASTEDCGGVYTYFDGRNYQPPADNVYGAWADI
jgi:hypothetical protein